MRFPILARLGIFTSRHRPRRRPSLPRLLFLLLTPPLLAAGIVAPAASGQELQPFLPPAAAQQPAPDQAVTVRRALPATPVVTDPPVARAVPVEPAPAAPVESAPVAPTPTPAPRRQPPPPAPKPAPAATPRAKPTPAPAARRPAPPAINPPPSSSAPPAPSPTPPDAVDAALATTTATPAPAPVEPSVAPTPVGSSSAAAPTPALAAEQPSSPRRPSPGSSAPPPADEGRGTIRLAPGQTGGPTVTADQLQLDSANQLYLKKQFALAAPEYEKYLGLYPDAPAADRQSALWFLSETYRQLKRLPAARNTYETLLSKFSEGQFVGPASYQLASIYFEEKNFKAGLPLFERSAAVARSDDVALSSRYYEALCLEQLGRRDETKEVYSAILGVTANNPYRELARLALARLAVEQKRPNEALEQYDALAKETTKPALRAEAIIKAGLLAKELGLNDKAAALLDRGARLNDAGPALASTAQLELLHLLYDTSKYPKLLETFNAFGRSLPEDKRPEAMLLAGNAMRQLNRHAEARTVYDQLLTEFPKSAQVSEARYQRIISLYSAGDPNFVREADDFLLLSSDPVKSDQVKLMKADTLFKKEDYPAAAAAYASLENSTRLPAKYKAEAAYRLGYALTQSKQPEKAIDAFSKFLKGYPESPLTPKALAQRALAYGQMKNYERALADFNDVIANHPQAKEREIALQQKALLLGQREDTRGMTETFRALLKDYPKTESAGQAHFFIGTAAYEAKDFPNARREFEAARLAAPKEYGPRALLRQVLCDYQLQDKAALTADASAYHQAKYSPEIPGTVLLWLGDRQFEEKNYAAAEDNLARAAASPTNDAPDTLLKLARCRLLLKKPDPALEAARAFLETAAATPVARANGLLVQGEAQLALKKYDDAQKSSEEALQLQPEGPLNAKGRLLGADVALARGQPEVAAKAYLGLSILTDDPEVTPLALRRAADAFEKAGNAAEAAKAREELKARFPNLAAQ